MNELHGQSSLIANKRTPFNRSQQGACFYTPFATLTTAHWEETRARAERCLDRFARVGEEKRANAAPMIGLETREVAERMLREASPMRADLPPRELAEVCPDVRAAQGGQ